MAIFEPDETDMAGFMNKVQEMCFKAVEGKGLKIEYVPGYRPAAMVAGLRAIANAIETYDRLDDETREKAYRTQQRLSIAVEQFMTDMQRALESDSINDLGFNPIERLFENALEDDEEFNEESD